MKNLLPFSFILIALLTFNSCAKLQHILEHQTQTGPAKEVLKNEEIIKGLKQALEKGTEFAVSELAVENGFYKSEAFKILLPKEAAPIYEQINKIPLVDQVLDNAVLSVNRTAEDAAAEAKPIFIQAIKEMTITDGMNILREADTAATAYLREKMRDKLYQAFKPKIEASLNKTYVGDFSAERTYKEAINLYNTASLNGFLFTKIENNSLVEHTTQKALDALFIKVAEEEKQIRKDPLHRLTDILQKVFGWGFDD